jgi:hypothetical protein
MKKSIILFALGLFFLGMMSCVSNENKTQDEQKTTPVKPTSSIGNFGESITEENAIDASKLPELLADTDSLEVKLSGNIEAVCHMTGCWMDVSLGNGETVYVTFKDDGFLVPMDAAGKQATISGVAKRNELSVDYLKRKAEDDGKTQEEIDAITEPAMEYSFIASGVIIK